MRVLSRLSLTSMVLAVCASGAPGKPFIDCSQEELIKAAPELSALAFDAGQSPLNPLLSAAREQLQGMVAKFMNISMAEEIDEMRFDSAHLMWKQHRDRFLYVVTTRPLAESRRQGQGPDAAPPNAKSIFLIAGPFVEMLGDLLPENQAQSRFRYLGRMAESGRPSLVLAFLEQHGSREGLVWVDEATKRLLRLRTDVLDHPNGGKFDTFSRDVRFVPVSFAALKTTLWLPSSATVHVRFAAGELHSVHRFSDYHADENGAVGEALGPAGMKDDAFEVLLKGLASLEAGKPEDATSPLRDAASRLPNRIEPGYYLGMALYQTHDWAGAETQFRETVKHSPGFAAAHDGLGVVLLKRGDQPGAVAELEEALRLEPGNEKIRASLEAAAKAPGVQVPASGTTIQVNVRQVLVPVVVSDKQGHHVTGLTQADFRVFEDGVEQKITAFSSERPEALAPASPGALPGKSDPAAAGAPRALLSKHTYVICLDMMHTAFANSVHVREALQKLFQQQQAGDSKYVVIALGKSLEVIVDPTSDPAKVLEVMNGTSFRNLYMRGQKSQSQFEISAYEEDLQRFVQRRCQSAEVCQAQAESWEHRAEELTERERERTMEFLAQFRSVVEELARDNGRRTMVLISDGILLAPGEIPYGLLQGYFPGYRTTRSLATLHYLLEPIFKLAVKANVSIYTIDSRGLYGPPGADATRNVVVQVMNEVNREWSGIATDQGLTLSEIAAATGGIAFQNSNDLFTGLQRAFADGREYYTLAYVSTNEAQDGKFRKIEVKVRDKGAQVNAKRGYWAAAP